MRYTYELFDTSVVPHKRLDISTSAASSLRELHNKEPFLWKIQITDNLIPTSKYVVTSIDQLEEWEDGVARASQWLDPALKESIKKKLSEKIAMGWQPFDEAETEIHMVDKPIPNKLGDSNRKNAAAALKPKVSDVPPLASFALGAAMSNGALKYGRFNWRDTGSTASVFYDAMRRHLDDWYSGEDFASDSGIHHLAHLMAGAAILLDTIAIGKLKDDRDILGPRATSSDIWLSDPKI
jgi:hypothetical protein